MVFGVRNTERNYEKDLLSNSLSYLPTVTPGARSLDDHRRAGVNYYLSQDSPKNLHAIDQEALQEIQDEKIGKWNVPVNKITLATTDPTVPQVISNCQDPQRRPQSQADEPQKTTDHARCDYGCGMCPCNGMLATTDPTVPQVNPVHTCKTSEVSKTRVSGEETKTKVLSEENRVSGEETKTKVPSEENRVLGEEKTKVLSEENEADEPNKQAQKSPNSGETKEVKNDHIDVNNVNTEDPCENNINVNRLVMDAPKPSPVEEIIVIEPSKKATCLPESWSPRQ